MCILHIKYWRSLNHNRKYIQFFVVCKRKKHTVLFVCFANLPVHASECSQIECSVYYSLFIEHLNPNNASFLLVVHITYLCVCTRAPV